MTNTGEFSTMVPFTEVKDLVADVLQVHERAAEFNEDTELLGSIPEFDSMAVVSIITALEEQFDIVVDDDEIDAETFATLGTLYAFVTQKLT
jgi:acyl carrier protein